MKKWLIILSIIFGISFISTAILAGRVYHEDLQVYTDYDKQELEVTGLKNIYIKSSIPIEVYPTAEKPYVEFNQKFSDIIGAAPEYELNVSKKGESTYIELNETKGIYFWLGVKDNQAQLSVYLPQSTINRLNIQDDGYVSSYRREKQVINLEGINVNELDVYTDIGEFILDGNYQKINISSRGSISLNSKSPAQVYINESMDQYLMGEFEKIKVINNRGTDIIIDSNSPSQVEINNNNGRIDLKGNYSKVKVEGDDNDLDLRSDSICQLVTNGYNNTMIANGPFKEISLDEYRTEAEIKTTIVPNKLNLSRHAEDNTINLTLPSNTPGLQVKYFTDYYMEEDDFEYYVEKILNNNSLSSDFELVQERTKENQLTFTYGNGALTITLNGNRNNTLQIVDGGYSSNIAQ